MTESGGESEKLVEKSGNRAVINQTLSAIICCLTSLSMGLTIGWSSAAFVKINNFELSFTLTDFQEALVVSALNVGIIFGAIPTTYLMDKLGRKSTMLYSSALGLLHWLLVATAMNPHMLYLGRFLGGIFNGMVTAIAPVYLTENLEPRIRGTIGTIFSIMIYAGILCTYIVGPVASYRYLSLFCGLWTVLFMVSFPFMPETPYFYVIKNRMEDARRSLLWLRGHANVDPELKVIETYVAAEQQHRGSWTDVFLDANSRRPFLICVVLSFIQKFTGFFTVISYQAVILPGMVGPLTSEQATLVIGVVLLCSGTFSAFFIDKVGRIALLKISCLGVVASMVPIGLWFYLNSNREVMYIDHYNYVPFLGFIFFIVFHAMGLGPVGNIYPGEVLPLSIKAEATALVVACAAVFTTVNTELFAFLNAYVGMWANYFCFAIVAVVGMAFTHMYVVETKEKSLQAIQEEFREQAKRPRMKGDYFLL